MRVWADGWLAAPRPTRYGPGDVTPSFPTAPPSRRNMWPLPPWQERAQCRDARPNRDYDPFFDREGYEEALALCADCPVRRTCLAEAMTFEAGARRRYGIRGGRMAEQRERVTA